jgi:hypothetical protein
MIINTRLFIFSVFPIRINTPDDDIELIERTTSAEPVEHEDDGKCSQMKCCNQHSSLFSDIHLEQTERTATEPVESPVQHERISEYNSTSRFGMIYHDLIFLDNQINNLPGGLIDVIDLTQEDDGGSDNPEVHEIQSNSVVSPITIDLTQDDDGGSDHPEIQSNSVVSPITIDLTQDDGEGSDHPEIQSNSVVSPISINLTTEDDNEQEGIELFFY